MSGPERWLSSSVLDDASPRARPKRQVISAQTVRLEPIDPVRHGEDLFAASHIEADPAKLWHHMGYVPSADRPSFQRWLEEAAASEDPLYFAVIDHAMIRYDAHEACHPARAVLGLIDNGEIERVL
ncbi:MAG: GNAT family N-acetyltransferase, partial [Pseudomonadota bacterium]